MQFGFDTVIKAFDKAFSLKKNAVAIVHLLIGLVALFALSGLGSYLTMSSGSPVWSGLFGLIGFVFFYYIMIRLSYFLTFFALKDLKDGSKLSYDEAKAGFLEQKWKAVFLPILLILGVLLVFLAIYIIGYIFSSWGDSRVLFHIFIVIKALLTLPFFLISFFLFMLLFLGSGLIFPILIDLKTGIAKTLEAVVLTIKEKFQSILVYKIIAGFLMLLLIGVLLLLFVPSLFVAAASGMGNPMAFFQSIAMGGNIVFSIIMIINMAAIFSFFLSYLYNVSAGIEASIYLAVKDGVDYSQKLSIDVKKIRESVQKNIQ
jgi:hypothetical protein